jgi:hypothetical protein
MSHPWTHAQSSVKLFGGIPEDYIQIHHWFDDTKASHPDWRHRALKHHTLGIFWCEEKFGIIITNSDSKQIPVRLIAEQHVKEDMGFIPTPSDWLNCMSLEKWQGHTDALINSKLNNKPVHAIPESISSFFN